VKKKRKNVKTATEKSSSASAANASTLGDSTDVLAALKAKMKRQRKII
jgi:small subunit ribosomal protein S1